jgi:hypothetical protein
MAYAKEFNHLEYNVPEFLLTGEGWEDVSWHNDVCPRFENRELGLAVWVDCNEPECREYEDWAQYTVVPITALLDGSTVLADEHIFNTEVQGCLEEWLNLYETKSYLERAFSSAGKCYNEDGCNIADELALLIAETQEAMDEIRDQEVPDCSPAGEPC